MFLRLVSLGEGVEDTRRRVLRSELTAIDIPMLSQKRSYRPGTYRLKLFGSRKSRSRELQVRANSGELQLPVKEHGSQRGAPEYEFELPHSGAIRLEFSAPREDDVVINGLEMSIRWDSASSHTQLLLT